MTFDAILIIVAALAAAIAMAVFLYVIEHLGIIKTRTFWTLGGLFFTDKRRAFVAALTVHLLAGVFFGFCYIGSWSLFDFGPDYSYLFLGLVTGALHGAFVAVGLIIALNNPREKHGFGVAMAQVAAHVLFGLILGAEAMVMETKWNTVADLGNYLRNVM